ncbi:hypothetical protein XENORESO_000872 [Xenotaenia resolanae]|uniref:Uncharacterized protein n=1 Tax=Xenotaenia resolanae TaxID=208358 RepID=A0ABV0W2S4_9TELE
MNTSPYNIVISGSGPASVDVALAHCSKGGPIGVLRKGLTTPTEAQGVENFPDAKIIDRTQMILFHCQGPLRSGRTKESHIVVADRCFSSHFLNPELTIKLHT